MIWLEIIVRDLRSARTIDMDPVEVLILSKWREKSTLTHCERENSLLMLTYWILKAQDSTNQEHLSNTMVQSLEIVFNPISRWIDSPHQKVILECIQMWFRLGDVKNSQESSLMKLKQDVLEFIIQMITKEPKICLNTIADYLWNSDNISFRAPLLRAFVTQLLKYALLKTPTDDDPLELSLISVEILVCLIDDSRSTDYIQILGRFYGII